MHVLWCILQHPMPHSVLVDGVDWQRLKPAPSKNEYEGIVGLENLLMPSVSLHADLNEAESVFCGCQTTQNDREFGIERVGEFVWHIFENDPSIRPSLVSFRSGSRLRVQDVKLGSVGVDLLLQGRFLSIVPFILSKLVRKRSCVVLSVGKPFPVFLFESKFEFLLSFGILGT